MVRLENVGGVSGHLEWGGGAIKTRFTNLSPEAKERLGGRSLTVQEDEADCFDVREGNLIYEKVYKK